MNNPNFRNNDDMKKQNRIVYTVLSLSLAVLAILISISVISQRNKAEPSPEKKPETTVKAPVTTERKPETTKTKPLPLRSQATQPMPMPGPTRRRMFSPISSRRYRER